MLQLHVLYFLLHYLSSVRLREVKENFKLLIRSFKSVRGLLEKVPNVVI